MKYTLTLHFDFAAPPQMQNGAMQPEGGRVTAERLAEYVGRAIGADPEPRPEEIARSLTWNGNRLTIVFASDRLRLIRTATSAMFEYVQLCARIIQRFHPDIRKAVLAAPK
jgi:tRNA threonylcarbamoyladenosine modification (KEOPS) complex  Pcc1 subunit